MASVTWTLTLVAVLCSRQGAQGRMGHVNIEDALIQAKSASPLRTLPFEVRASEVRIVSKEALMFRQSRQNTPYPAVMILYRERYNGSAFLDVNVFDVRNILAKTWQPFQREINLEQMLGSACSELLWLPTLTTCPSRQRIIIYGFGTGQCAEKLVLYGDRRSRVITTTGGHAAMGATLATMAVGESDNSTFDLFAFGGAEYLDGSNSSSHMLTNSLRRLRIVSSEECVICSRPQWRVMDESKSAHGPTARLYADMFADGASLLLFGGVSPTSKSNVVQFIPDFWRYSLAAQQWVQLHSNLHITSSRPFYLYPSVVKSVQTAFLADEGTMLVALGRSLYFCSISPLFASCNTYKYKIRDRSYYLSASHSFFYLINTFTHTDKSFKIEVFKSGAGAGKTIRAITTPQIEQDIDTRVREIIALPGMFVPHHGSQRNQYLFFSQVHIDSSDEPWCVDRCKATSISIWSIQETYGYYKKIAPSEYWYSHTFNTPAPHHCSSVTYLNPSTALLYERHSRIWCLSIPTYSWTPANTDSNYVPPNRIDHVAYKHGSTGLVLYGGYWSLVLGDLWLFQLQESKNCAGSWHNLTPYITEGNLPKLRSHSVTEYGNDVIIFGGDDQRLDSLPALGQSPMFMLQIKSKTRVLVRNIEIVPPIQSRIYNTISMYTKTDLLLLGGNYVLKKSKVHFAAADALLMTLKEENHTIVAKWNVFFKLGISFHIVLNNRVFSGFDSTGTKKWQFYEIGNTNQCPKGYQRSNLTDSCLPCPVGYYSATIEQQCEKCGNLTTTKGQGSTACEPINPCTAGYCNGHGLCFVNKADYKPFCTCQFGYVPSDQCKVPSVYLALMAAVVFATTATILVIALYQFVRKRRALNATEIQLGNTNRDLQQHQKKLRQVNRGAHVRWSDLTIKEQIKYGTYSKVFLAELGDIIVVVKQFPSYFTTGSLSSPYDVFIQEAEILRGLRHPNIVMFIGAGRDATSGCPFLVMEYLRRGSLHDVLHDLSNPIEHCDRLRFALDASRGLKYLHSSSPPQIHRDIKSPNLLVSDKWVVKVGDLETARFLSTYQSSVNDADDNSAGRPAQHGGSSRRREQSSISYNSGSNQLTTRLLAKNPTSGNTAGELDVTSRVGMTCGAGTDRWRSPESIKKNIYTEKHDIYSYGVVLWEIFTRQTPYSDFTCSEAILDEIVNERKPIFPPSAPYAYRHLAEQCMKTDAVDRPSIQRVVRELIEQFETL